MTAKAKKAAITIEGHNADQELAAQAPVYNRRILIVDDEQEILEAYKGILSPPSNVVPLRSSRSSRSSAAGDLKDVAHEVPVLESFELTLVSTGEAALAEVKKSLAEGRPFAVGFYDVLLGAGMDGIEAVRAIHGLDSEMYAVLVTAYQDRNVNTINKLFGPQFQDRWDYLNKPFTEGEIIQKARSMTSMWNIRKQEERSRAQLDELKEKMNENEKLLTLAAVSRSVGHEFGNILLQIMGRAELARNSPENEMRQALDVILTATEHASQVLNRFKNMAKPSEQSTRFELLSILEPIKDTLLLMDHEIKRRGVEVNVNVHGVPSVEMNRTSMVQVFMNLVINALHALPEYGVIHFTAKTSGEGIEVIVTDNGPGIPTEHLAKIFEPFFTTKGDKGTGLGLSICKEVVEIFHRGQLTARNLPAGGAEFRICVPFRREGGHYG